MINFSEIMIIRYYELDWIEVTYSDDISKENIDMIYKKLDKEMKENKHLESSKIIIKGKDFEKEENRVF